MPVVTSTYDQRSVKTGHPVRNHPISLLFVLPESQMFLSLSQPLLGIEVLVHARSVRSKSCILDVHLQNGLRIHSSGFEILEYAHV
jgi:hypothetical protein